MDAWVACVAMMASTVVFVLPPARTPWHGMALLVAILMLVPGLQYSLGLVTFAGDAWISTAYLVGFLLALLTGARWETMRPRHMLDHLFLAIGVAALLSVGLQFHQWLRLDRLDIWSMGEGVGRPFANFGQPNQLGTFLIWGLLALAWGVIRRHIGGGVAIGISLYLSFGLALTSSHTAWLAISLLVACSWMWRRFWPDARWSWMVSGLAVYFVLCNMCIGWLSQALTGASAEDWGGIARISGESRPAIWALFLDAALQQPWWGYGWNQVVLAQMAVALEHPPLHVYFAHSHNLFLDLMVWCGIPLGLMVSAWLLRWFWLRVRTVANAENAVLVLFLLVVGNHAMLELPLHHAYFLLPAGLVIGALDVRMDIRPIIMGGRVTMRLLWLVCVILLALIIRDYARVEPAYQKLRFEWAHVKTEPANPPDVLLLTQWRDFVRFVRFEPTKGIAPADLQWMRDVAALYPSAGFFQKLATALALNQHPKEASQWLSRLCQVVSTSQCASVKAAWVLQAKNSPEVADVRWPK